MLGGDRDGRPRDQAEQGDPVGALHPHYVSIAQTMAKFTAIRVEYAQPTLSAPRPTSPGWSRAVDDETGCVVVQYPDILGRIGDMTALAEACHAKGALLIAVMTEPVALGALRSPGEMGADIVVGEGQAIGVGLQFGGPYLGLFAVRDPKHVRQMPGRLCGETVDAEGKRGFVLTLSTREQHIRREKATSNICTNSGLCALAFSIHLTLLGEKGLRALAAENHRLACHRRRQAGAGARRAVLNDELLQRVHRSCSATRGRWSATWPRRAFSPGFRSGGSIPTAPGCGNGLFVAVTETVTEEDIEALASALKEEPGMNAPNTSGWKPGTPEAPTVRAAIRDRDRQSRADAGRAADLRDRRDRHLRCRSARAEPAGANRLGGLDAPKDSACPVCPSPRRCATTRASAARTTPSTAACSRSAAAR